MPLHDVISLSVQNYLKVKNHQNISSVQLRINILVFRREPYSVRPGDIVYIRAIKFKLT